MRSDAADYVLLSPKSLHDALAALDARPGELRPLAGGTDVMAMMVAGKLPHAAWLDLWGIDELRGIVVGDESVELGALTTYTELQAHPTIARELPMLVLAASETGGPAIQNRGTLGGNIGNASPAADSPPALLAYGAELELASAKGTRRVAYDRYHVGYKQTALAPNEIVTRVIVPRIRAGTSQADSPPSVHYYRKVGPRRAQAISKVCFAACAQLDGERATTLRIALGGVAPVPLCASRTAQALLDHGLGDLGMRHAQDALSSEITPIDDVRSTARYRKAVAANLLEDLVVTLRAHVDGTIRGTIGGGHLR
jgi:CO/xanthine dehydrogenase FAD-binding subunit